MIGLFAHLSSKPALRRQNVFFIIIKIADPHLFISKLLLGPPNKTTVILSYGV